VNIKIFLRQGGSGKIAGRTGVDSKREMYGKKRKETKGSKGKENLQRNVCDDPGMHSVLGKS
jgi:hypothetical protein